MIHQIILTTMIISPHCLGREIDWLYADRYMNFSIIIYLHDMVGTDTASHVVVVREGSGGRRDAVRRVTLLLVLCVGLEHCSTVHEN